MNFIRHDLDQTHAILSGVLPREVFVPFDALWREHPETYHEIEMHGRRVKTPRWQQAYGRDYQYTGNLNKALPILSMLEPVLDWCRQSIDKRLNGLLVNWYGAKEKHYIGLHRDSPIGLLTDAPIVTVSLGGERVFRMKQYRGTTTHDFPALDRSVFIIPFDTNRAWMHAVPRFVRYRSRRISVTLRAFEND